jgi:hypothetical protein
MRDIRVERAHVVVGETTEELDRAAELLDGRGAAGALAEMSFDRAHLLR